MMAVFIGLCSLASVALFFPKPGDALLAVVLFSIGMIAVGMAVVPILFAVGLGLLLWKTRACSS